MKEILLALLGVCVFAALFIGLTLPNDSAVNSTAPPVEKVDSGSLSGTVACPNEKCVNHNMATSSNVGQKIEMEPNCGRYGTIGWFYLCESCGKQWYVEDVGDKY